LGCYAPKTLGELQRFEDDYERIGIPALIVQVVTGFDLAQRYRPTPSAWFD
ncbi:MAG: hypothetical protein ACI8Z5_000651, partial [Lentimonas sp.]